jgi:hypothetical protein
MPRKLTGGSLPANIVQQFIEDSYMKKNERPKVVGKFHYDPNISTETVAVYYNHIDMTCIIVYRGTEPSLKDWSFNAFYAVGAYKSTSRFKEAEAVTKKAKENYREYKFITISHSQGAVPQRYLNDNDISEVITLNPAVRGEKVRKNETRIASDKDVVSNAFDVLTKGKVDKDKKNTTFIPAESNDFLAEHSPKILERLGNKEIGKIEGSGLNRYATANYLLSLYK